MISFDFKTYSDITDEEIATYDPKIKELSNYFKTHQNMMGWAYPKNLKKQELIDEIKKTSLQIKNNCDAFLVVGIGGSYLGSLAVIESLSPYFYNEQKKPEIYFLGTSLSSEYLIELKELIKNKDIIVNYISKSGTTFETRVVFDLILDIMKEKYSSEELKERIILTGGNGKANAEGYKTFDIPNDIGGRYSVFTPVGLLPIAVAGINIEELLDGAIESQKTVNNQIKYAIIRDILYKKGTMVEAFVAYEPKLDALTEWLKQLYSESLGKDGKGTLPIGIINTRDLHSMGQFIQDGSHILFETVINILEVEKDIEVDEYKKSLNEINNIASKATSIAHFKDGVINNIINVDKLTTFNLGYILQFFMISCAVNGHLSDVDAFNQEGVEKYKETMKKILAE